MALVGNKADLQTVREVTKEVSSNLFCLKTVGSFFFCCFVEDLFNIFLQEAELLAEENGMFFIETSAKTALNINELFYEIGQ